MTHASPNAFTAFWSSKYQMDLITHQNIFHQSVPILKVTCSKQLRICSACVVQMGPKSGDELACQRTISWIWRGSDSGSRVFWVRNSLPWIQRPLEQNSLQWYSIKLSRGTVNPNWNETSAAAAEPKSEPVTDAEFKEQARAKRQRNITG